MLRQRFAIVSIFPVLLALVGCSTIDTDRTTLSYPTALRTRITFEPLDREKAQRYLEAERQVYRENTAPMKERKAALELGREERYLEVSREFPECKRQTHCLQKISTGDVKRFERYGELSREILEYDKELIELEAALRDWQNRLEIRQRAIINRFVVHEILQLPTYERRFRGILAYSLESFETRRQLSMHLMRPGFSATELQPRVIGDYDFRMLGRSVDEAAVVATFEVYLMTPSADFEQPTRYVVSLLVNTHQLDLRFYDKDFLRTWAEKLVEPYQNKLREEAYCGIYSIASDTLAPRLNVNRQKKCAPLRSELRSMDASRFPDRFAPDRWLLAISYFPMNRGSQP